MRAMILAAGRGRRMRPLTDHCPKPLLPVAGRPLIEWPIRRLVAAGLRHIVINHAWLGDRIVAALGDGHALGARLHYSAESPALDTAGGIARALPFFEAQPFLVINGDVWCDWDPANALRIGPRLTPRHPAHLLLVRNPEHHPEGDFALDASGRVRWPEAGEPTLTFSGIGVYHPALFASIVPGQIVGLASLLRQAMPNHLISAEYYDGDWADVGTPARLAALDRRLRSAEQNGNAHNPRR